MRSSTRPKAGRSPWKGAWTRAEGSRWRCGTREWASPRRTCLASRSGSTGWTRPARAIWVARVWGLPSSSTWCSPTAASSTSRASSGRGPRCASRCRGGSGPLRPFDLHVDARPALTLPHLDVEGHELCRGHRDLVLPRSHGELAGKNAFRQLSEIERRRVPARPASETNRNARSHWDGHVSVSYRRELSTLAKPRESSSFPGIRALELPDTPSLVARVLQDRKYCVAGERWGLLGGYWWIRKDLEGGTCLWLACGLLDSALEGGER